MTEDNPFSTPQVPPSSPGQVPARTKWQFGFLLCAVVVATLPLYGLIVRAGRDPQWLALVIFFGWGLTWLLAIVVLALNFIIPQSTFTRWAWASATIYLFAAGGIGWFAVKHTFFELLAG